MQLSEIVIP
ncbi:hypothetical protein NOCA2350054 [metagenome]|uniref:Uncharacterized protein n=1 Tax=metagenome TaxID=256318 RepID=A0A2P2C6W8_9ZZZZ